MFLDQYEPRIGGRFTVQSPKSKDVKPRIDAKSLHYHSDGSGRDKYIT